MKNRLAKSILIYALIMFFSSPAKAASTYKDGLFFSDASGNYSIKTNVLLQAQHEYLKVDNGTDTNGFRTRRARFVINGSIADPRLKYKLETEFAGTNGGATAHPLDASIDWQWFQSFQIRAGQFKVPYTYETLSSSTKLLTIGRTISDGAFSLDRDVGVNIHGKVFKDRFGYNLFAMNGEGRNQASTNKDMLFGTRLTYDVWSNSKVRLSNSKPANDPELAFSIAAVFNPGNSALANQNTFHTSADIKFRYHGWSLLSAGHFVNNSSTKQKDYGFLSQLACFLIPQKLEAVGRSAGVIRDTAGAFGTGSVNSYEAGAGVNYYFAHKNAKLQLDYNLLWNNAATQDRDDHQIRTQVQVWF